MNTTFRLQFLGPVQAEQDGEPLRGFRSRKALALLGYLAAQGQPLPRERLVDMFWEDQTESRGRANLSWVLNKLKALLPDCLQADRHTVRFQRADPYWLDLDAFDELEAQGEPDALAEAVELYRGEFLEGLYLEGCTEFELWVVTERERWRQRVHRALETLVAHHSRRGEYEQSLHFARRLLALEPWQEKVQRQVMHLLVQSGQRAAALAQYKSCRRVLAKELGAEPATETTALYERIQAADSRRHDLPAQPTPFLGRKDELVEIARLLDDPDCRLLTILGPGGIGKTRLALQVGQAKTQAFLEGVHFVPLAALGSADSLLSALADALQFSLAGPGPPQAQLLNYLRGKQVLLILDNFEHLIPHLPPLGRDRGGKVGGAELLGEILKKAPEVKLLVTSRERLNLRWERCFEIAGLDYPNETTPRADLQAYSAVQLFQQAAQQVRQDFVLSEQDRPAVAHICQLVEGLPLGIELAAAWAGTYTCEEIAGEIERGLDFLATSLRDVPQRHRSVQATFEHSWRLLTPPEQGVLMALSVFRQGFQRKAAKEVAGATPIVLKSLVDKSLLRFLPSGRYEMHEMLRQYAADKLNTMPKAQAGARDQHCAHFVAFLQRQESNLVGGGVAEALAAIRAEIANVRAAWHWAVTNAKLKEIERGLNGLSRFYLFTGPCQEGQRLSRMAIDCVRALLGQGYAPEREAQVILSKLLVEQARFLNRQGMYEQAITAAQDAIGLARISQALHPEAAGCLQRGRALWCLGDYIAAQSQFESAMSLAQGSALRLLKAKSLRHLGKFFEHKNDYARAKAYFEQALRISQEIGDQQEEGIILNSFGLAAVAQGDYATARSHYEQALRTSRKIGDRWLESVVLINFGMLSNLQGDWARAKAYYEQSLRIQRDFGDQRAEGIVLINLGLLSNQQGDFARAKTHYEQSLRIHREIGDRNSECAVLSNLGLLSHRQGDYAAAQEFSSQALQLAQELGFRFLQGFALTHLGHALTGLGQLTGAANAYQEAVDVRRELGQSNLAIESLSGLARVALAQDELVHAQGQIEEILVHLETGNLDDAMVEPLWVYLTCYRVLRANDDPRAYEILSTAHSRLQEHAARISDEEMRRSFLENVAAHREIVEEIKSGLGQAPQKLPDAPA